MFGFTRALSMLLQPTVLSAAPVNSVRSDVEKGLKQNYRLMVCAKYQSLSDWSPQGSVDYFDACMTSKPPTARPSKGASQAAAIGFKVPTLPRASAIKLIR